MKKISTIVMIVVLAIILIAFMSLPSCKTTTKTTAAETTAAAAETTAAAAETTATGTNYKLCRIDKTIGNPYFDAEQTGWKETAKELGFEVIMRGPEQTTAEAQIEIMTQLIAQHVNGISYFANDPSSLAPSAKKAMDAGIKVVGMQSGKVADSRNMSTEPVDPQLVGIDNVKMMAQLINYEGEIAIVSSTPTMENQNVWIGYMKEELKKPEYAKMKLVDVVYPDLEDMDHSYAVALGLIKAHPNLRGIISPTTVGIAASAKAITDKGLVGKIELTGLGLPSQMAEYVTSGVCKLFGLWSPIDEGYWNAYILYNLVTGKITGAPGEEFDAGRMGHFKIVPVEGQTYGIAYMGGVLRFDKNNIDKYKAFL
ncbi:MAG: rhamnose ABC transporter substrate-binding protein [Candidatus Humimicrobiaceae bacterium]